jgi:hypothetical protein
MAGFVQGVDREQVTLFPVRLDAYVAEDNPVRAVDAFVDVLDLDGLGFIYAQPLDIGRPGYDPRMMLMEPGILAALRLTGLATSGTGPGYVKTKSDLVVMPSEGRIFAFFCSPHDHRAHGGSAL